jgi:tetratricopeptide (TPR) repeat protein
MIWEGDKDGQMTKNDPLAQADRALEQRDYPRAEALARPLIESADPKQRQFATETLALALFHQRRLKESLELFLPLARELNSGKNWMNVSTIRASMGDADGAEEAMEKAIPLQIDLLNSKPELQGVPFVNILTPAYMIYFLVRSLCEGGNAARAIPWLERLRGYYENRVTDEHLLICAGTPTLPQFLEALEDVMRGAGTAFDAGKWIRSFQKSLDEEGRAVLDDFLKDRQL